MAQDVTVTIRSLPNNPAQCTVDPNPFSTSRGHTVTFVFAFDTADGHVVFDGASPFDDDPETPGKFRPKRAHKVKNVVQDGKKKTFKYKVTWSNGGGNGDGQGEVIPS